MFSSFYRRLGELRTFHRRFPGVDVPQVRASRALPPRAPPAHASPPPSQFDPQSEVEMNVQFSGEEMFGKYLDMATLHEQFVNIPGAQR